MKRIIITSIAFLAMFATSAQARDISTGTIMITGDTKIDTSSGEVRPSGGKITTDSSEINLTSAYFVANNVGVGLLLSSETSEVDDGSTVSKQTVTMVGPLVGYNISFNDQTSMMLHAGVFALNGELDSADLDGSGYLLGAFVNYFLNDTVAVNGGLRMVNADVDLKNGGSTVSADMEETGLSVGLSLFF